jgi:hypothetical protein
MFDHYVGHKVVTIAVLLAISLLSCANASEPLVDPGQRNALKRASTRLFLQSIGYGKDSDEYRLLVQASSHYFTDEVEPLSPRQIQSARAIVAFSFGQAPPARKGGQPLPGATNEGLAKICRDLHRHSSIPVAAQWEISDVLAQEPGTKVACSAVPIKGYLSTIGVIDQFEAAGVMRPGDSLVLVASHEHGFRVRKLLEKRGYHVLSGRNCYVPEGGWKQFRVDDEFGYTGASTQVWTRSRANFICEEFYWLVHELHAGKIDL